jgi:putative tryptophan/tyrosine transport system ATP-binding protein
VSKVDLEHVGVTFNPRSPLEMKALRPTSLSIPNGQFVSVIGSNGAGKSTLLSLIAGDIRSDSGTIRISNEDVTRQSTFQRARKIGRVFQDPLAGTCGDLTILENLAIAQSRYAPQKLRLAISKGLRELCADRVSVLGIGLENRLDDVVKLLSGGQRQALSLVMATLHTPDRTHPTSAVLSDGWYYAKRVTLSLALRSSGDAGRGFGRVGAAAALVAE